MFVTLNAHSMIPITDKNLGKQVSYQWFSVLSSSILFRQCALNMETLCSIYNFNLIAVINQKSELLGL